MGLFNFGKKKKEQEPTCAYNAPIDETKEEVSMGKVLKAADVEKLLHKLGY